MKKVFFLFCFVAMAVASFAQNGSAVSDKYMRSGLSIITIQRGDSYDATASRIVEKKQMGDKFDYNIIQSKYLQISKDRDSEISDSEIDAATQNKNYGKEILSYIFDRKSDGRMSDKIILQRGKYNATDQEVINAKASKVGASIIGETGHNLVSSSYIYFVDFYDIRQGTTRSWFAHAKAFVYKISLSHEDLMDFYEKTWIYDDDSQSAKAEKINAFNNYPVKIELIKSATAMGASKDFDTALESAYELVLPKLETKVADLSATIPVYSIKPITAKVGTKENLKNGDRYRAYSYAENRDGEIISVKKGFVRATEVVNNSKESTGETEPSKFYQISGMADIQPGWVLKQSNDNKLGVSLAPKFGSMGTYWVNIDAGTILHIGKTGNTSYILLGLGMDYSNLKDGVGSADVSLGYGYGIHLSRFFELMPYAGVGSDIMIGPESETDYGSETTSVVMTLINGFGLYAEGGLQAAINLCYPLQLIGKINYDYLIPIGKRYDEYNALFTKPHKSGLNYQFGIKWNF